MTALVLVVDDRPTNVLLLETKLSNEYYDVVTARDGFEALRHTKERHPDLLLLDVMMPGIDGFEVCRRLKSDPEVAHIPVVMLTALSSKSDRLRGLEVGADDFLTKPFNDIVFFSRTRSLIRIKQLMDELRLREQTAVQVGMAAQARNMYSTNVAGSRVLVVEDNAAHSARMLERLSELYTVETATDAERATALLKQQSYDVILISTEMNSTQGLHLATYLKSREETRHVPLVMLVDESRTQTMLKALELGINDYLLLPLDTSEMMARVKTQIRRKKYQDALLAEYVKGSDSRLSDTLTKLYNRSFMDAHLKNHVMQAQRFGRAFTMLLLDIDHFKPLNDTYGHQTGDEFLYGLGQILLRSVRGSDMVARFGGEEFALLLPFTDAFSAQMVAERIRKTVESYAFRVSHAVGSLSATVSIGVAEMQKGESAAALMKQADEALYRAKQAGRNQVQLAE